MTDYTWKPKGLKVNIQAIAIDPILAFKLFVLPVMNNPGWIENSRDVTDTKLSSREWAGLVLHAISLIDKTGDDMQIAKESTGGDGALVRSHDGKNEAVLVEQTLATHMESSDLLKTIERRVQAKSGRGSNYSENKHLVVMCNIPGDLVEAELTKVVANGAFNIVNIIGFHEDERGRHFLCFVFDRDNTSGPIHRCAVDEEKLRQVAMDLPLPDKNN